jgi:hypothetical protein
VLVRSGHAFRAARLLMQREGVFGGVSAGAVLHAGLKFAERLDRGNIVMIFADGGWKYLGTDLWSKELSSKSTKSRSTTSSAVSCAADSHRSMMRAGSWTAANRSRSPSAASDSRRARAVPVVPGL